MGLKPHTQAISVASRPLGTVSPVQSPLTPPRPILSAQSTLATQITRASRSGPSRTPKSAPQARATARTTCRTASTRCTTSAASCPTPRRPRRRPSRTRTSCLSRRRSRPASMPGSSRARPQPLTTTVRRRRRMRSGRRRPSSPRPTPLVESVARPVEGARPPPPQPPGAPDGTGRSIAPTPLRSLEP